MCLHILPVNKPLSFTWYEDLTDSSGDMQNSQTFAINQLMVLACGLRYVVPVTH
jgi:hypothetical protein